MGQVTSKAPGAFYGYLTFKRSHYPAHGDHYPVTTGRSIICDTKVRPLTSCNTEGDTNAFIHIMACQKDVIKSCNWHCKPAPMHLQMTWKPPK